MPCHCAWSLTVESADPLLHAGTSRLLGTPAGHLGNHPSLLTQPNRVRTLACRSGAGLQEPTLAPKNIQGSWGEGQAHQPLPRRRPRPGEALAALSCPHPRTYPTNAERGASNDKRTRSSVRGQSSNAFQKVVTASRWLGFFVPAFNIKVSRNFLGVIMGIKAQHLHQMMGGECLVHSRCSINATCSREVAMNVEGMFATLLPTLVTDKGLLLRNRVCPVCPNSPSLPHSLCGL